MIPALIFLVIIVAIIAVAARAIWIDARRRSAEIEPTELDIDDEHDVKPFRTLGSAAADVVRQAERRRA